MCLCNPQKRRLREITVFQYPKNSYREDEGALFTTMQSKKTRDRGYKLLQWKIHVDLRQMLFTMEQTARDMVQSLLLIQLHRSLDNRASSGLRLSYGPVILTLNIMFLLHRTLILPLLSL